MKENNIYLPVVPVKKNVKLVKTKTPVLFVLKIEKEITVNVLLKNTKINLGNVKNAIILVMNVGAQMKTNVKKLLVVLNVDTLN